MSEVIVSSWVPTATSRFDGAKPAEPLVICEWPIPRRAPMPQRAAAQSAPSQRLLYDRSDLVRRGIKLSPSTLLRLEAAGEFPKRIYLGRHSVAWLAVEIHAHIIRLAAARER